MGCGDWAQSPIPNPQSPIPISVKENIHPYRIILNFYYNIINIKK